MVFCFVHLVRFKDPITDKGKARTHQNGDETQMMQTCHENTKMRTTAASLTASSPLKIGRNPKGSRIVFQLPTIILAEILHHLGCFSCRVNSGMFATNLNWFARFFPIFRGVRWSYESYVRGLEERTLDPSIGF